MYPMSILKLQLHNTFLKSGSHKIIPSGYIPLIKFLKTALSSVYFHYFLNINIARIITLSKNRLASQNQQKLRKM